MPTKAFDHGYIYAISMPGSQLVKIGYTSDSVRKRLSALQSGSPRQLEVRQEILVQYPQQVEQWLHAFLAPHRVQGEWFKLDHTLLPALVTKALQAVTPHARRRMACEVGNRITFRLPPPLASQLEEVLIARGMQEGELTISDLIREALDHYLHCQSGADEGVSEVA